MLELFAGFLIATANPSQSCLVAIETEVRQLNQNGFARNLIKDHSLRVVSLINNNKLTLASAEIFTANRLRRFYADERFRVRLAKGYMTRIKKVLDTEVCEGYSYE